MKMKTLRLFAGAAVAAVALTAAAPVSAQAFGKYVALGDSLTAGWQSGCLVQRNQVNSYPAVLARAFDIDDFQQPLVQEVAATNPIETEACLGAVFIPPATITVGNVSQMGAPLNFLLPRPYDNLGIPGAEVADLINLRHGNPFGTDVEIMAALILRNFPGGPFDGMNAIDEANILLGGAAGSRLVTLWIGNNDVLGAATSGIVVDGVTLTSVATFASGYQAILDALLTSDRFVVANIPDVTALPFTTTIPPILVNPTTRQPVIIDGHTVPLLGAGNAAYPCTPVPPDHGCPLPAGTLVNLPASSLLAQGIGVPVAAGGTGNPLPHGFIDTTGPHAGVTLYPDEVALLQERTEQYNDLIATLTAGATLVDAHARFEEIKAHGYHVGGLTLTTSFLTGGVFGYDGVHPSSIGYRIVADEFIQAMNADGDDLPRPSFADVLFAPNVPVVQGAGVRDGGAWDYSFETWREVLSRTVRDSARIQLPRLPAPAADRPGPRRITRD